MLRVADVMSTQLITLTPMDSLKKARETMEKHRIRHIPVISSEAGFVGLLSQRDVLKAAVSHFADMQSGVRDEIESGIPIAEAMSAHVVTIPPDTPISVAGKLLLEHKFGCLPVLSNNKLQGILTETDFIKLCLSLLERSGDEA